MGKNILIVDDEELITKSLVKFLGREGYGVTIANTGEEALRVIDGADFDLIISDVRMPGMDGVETIVRIRARLKELGKIPVPEILITGYADKSKYDTAMRLKVAEYVYKPFDTKEFLRTVKRIAGEP